LRHQAKIKLAYNIRISNNAKIDIDNLKKILNKLDGFESNLNKEIKSYAKHWIEKKT
jgi:hypothetical protein